MSTQLQLRRDTTSNVGGITPAQGEPIFDVTRKALVLGDGATAGGNCVTPFSGTWTPQLNFDGAHAGMTTSFLTGWYQVVGQLCFLGASIILSAKGTSTGDATITGLPFPAANNGGPPGVVVQGYHNAMATSFVPEHYIPTSALDQISLGKSNNTANAALADTDFTNNSEIDFLCIYQIAQPTA